MRVVCTTSIKVYNTTQESSTKPCFPTLHPGPRATCSSHNLSCSCLLSSGLPLPPRPFSPSPFAVVLCRVVLCCVVLCCVGLCCVTLCVCACMCCGAVLCLCAVLCCVVLCCVVLCCVVLCVCVCDAGAVLGCAGICSLASAQDLLICLCWSGM
jgi:hypothetical protein